MAETVASRREKDFGERVVETAKRVATMGVIAIAAFCVAPDILDLACGNLGTP